VEEPACYTTQPAVSIAEFSALYERCMASGLKARVVISHAAGAQTSIFRCCYHWCEAPQPSTAQTCCHHRGRLHGRNLHGHCSLSDCRHSRRKHPHATHTTFAEAITPPPKRIRRRRNEVELLRGAEGEDDLLLSPLSCTSPPPPSSSSSPSRSLTPSSASPPLLPSALMDHVPASPPTCPPTPPERPELPPPAEPAPASPPLPAADLSSPSTSPQQPASRPPAPAVLAKTHRHLRPPDSCRLPPAIQSSLNSPNCKTNLMDNREFECYACQDRRYYCSVDYEQE
jgi:hypothetical protein